MAGERQHEMNVVAAARTEARRMADRVVDSAPDATVSMRVDQFRQLAQLIDALAGVAARDGQFDAPIDGIRFWVPLPHLAAERARFARMLAARPVAAEDRFAF